MTAAEARKFVKKLSGGQRFGQYAMGGEWSLDYLADQDRYQLRSVAPDSQGAAKIEILTAAELENLLEEKYYNYDQMVKRLQPARTG